MLKLATTLSLTSLLLAGGAHAQSNDFATGNMHFDAKDMDTNGDHMVSREEMQQYAEKLWQSMSGGKDTIPISVATKDFATGGVNFSARAMDTNHDGSISKEEFLAYTGRKYDAMKKTDSMVSVVDMANGFARGNRPSRATKSKTSTEPAK